MNSSDQPVLSSSNTLPRKSLLARMQARNPIDLFSDLLALWRARWSLRGAETLGVYTRLWGHVLVRNQGRMRIGSHVRLNGTITPLELGTGVEGCLEIGDRVFINYGSSIAAIQSVRIGPNCSIGTYSIIIDNNFHRMEPERRNEMPESAPVILEENVWLGARVIVLPGVTIGRGSVIGAGSVVTGSIPPRSVAAGVPARVIKTLS